MWSPNPYDKYCFKLESRAWFMRLFQEHNPGIKWDLLAVEINCLISNNTAVWESHIHWTSFGHGIVVQDMNVQLHIGPTEHSEQA